MSSTPCTIAFTTRGCIVLFSFVIVATVAPAQHVGALESVQTWAEQQLSISDRLAPKPPPCESGYAASRSGYVLAAATWAQQEGLRLGDRIVGIGGVQVAHEEDRIKAVYRLPPDKPIVIDVERQGTHER